jgi:hypothetical protein
MGHSTEAQVVPPHGGDRTTGVLGEWGTNGEGPTPTQTGVVALAPQAAPAANERRASPPLRQLLIGVDLLALTLGWGAALLTAHLVGDITFGPITAGAQTALVLGGGIVVLSASGLYRRRVCAIRASEVARTARASLGLAGVAVVLLASVGREAALAAGLAGGVMWFTLLTAERGLFREWIHGRRAGGGGELNAVRAQPRSRSTFPA